MRRLLSPLARSQRGVSMIEVLVTLLVLSVGLLGIAALQVRTLQFNQDAYYRSQANVLLYDMAERSRSHPELDAGFATEKALWQQQVADTLPDGQGSAECDADLCNLTVSWQGRSFLDDSTAADDAQESLQLAVKVGVL